MKTSLFVLVLVFFICCCSCFGQDFEAITLSKPKPAQQAEPTSAQPLLPGDPSSGGNSGCVDDPRLETDIVDIMQSDNPVIVPPITVTPETYLTLDSEVVAKLAGNMVICPKNPVLKNGKTVRKISVEFPVLWEQILNATKDGDEARLKMLLSNFVSKPMNPSDMFMLNIPIGLDNQKMDFLYENAGMKKSLFKEVIDFFIFTGGKSTEKAIIFIGKDYKGFSKQMEEAKKAGIPVYTLNLFDTKNNYGGYREYFSDRLKSAGLEAYVER